MRSMTCCRRSSGSRNLAPAALAAGVFLLLTGCAPADNAATARYVPSGVGAVVVADARDMGEMNDAGSLRRALSVDPANATLAAEFAADALRRYALSGDAQLLGYAATALAPWSEDDRPPLDIWLLRARLAQTHHEFDDAANDLAALLAVHPGNIEALLLASDAARRAGDVATARRHCVGLQLAGQPALARLCAADVLLTLGRAERALQAAQVALQSDLLPAEPSVRAWAATVYGDAAQASGDLDAARIAFKRALAATEDAPLSLRISYIDLLLAQRDYAVAASLLQFQRGPDALLLRQAIVAQRLNQPGLAALQDELERRFAQATAGDPLAQLRERALFELHVAQRPERALELARRNWELQKGWEDAALLVDAATAAGDDGVLHKLQEWRDAMAVST